MQYYNDPFLEEQNRLAGLAPGQNPNMVSVNMPSLRQEPKRMDPSQFMKMPETPSLLQMAIAKKAAEAAPQAQGYDPTGKTPEQVMAETGRQSELDEMRKQEALQPQMLEQIAQPMPEPQAAQVVQQIEQNKPIETIFAETGRQSELDQMTKEGVELANPVPPVQEATPSAAIEQPTPEPLKPIENGQPTILSAKGTLGAAAGHKQSADVFSRGINTGRDIRVQVGTSVAVPQGKWEVVQAFNGAKGKGYIGDGTNSGYGNSVLVKNTETGEKMRFSHLDIGSVSAKVGDVIDGGTVVGRVGVTGNTSGPHLDLEYYDSKGSIRDIMNTKYGSAMFGDGKQKAAPMAVEPVQQATESAQPMPQMSFKPAEPFVPQSPIMSVEPVKQPNFLELLGLQPTINTGM